MSKKIENRTKFLTIRIKPTELEKLKAKALEKGLRLSDFIRKIIEL